ncbi:MAG TPA: twin-arginine translocase subunit TatC [Candidatus Goldiibacteriota bacterium]|nr:twin-arginine translocase subunit TatC [Candidatus Goldiibacteriota bacterium]HPI02278.1 twin-arginine translocase subunit TatC [Candidatus Goldiibacteriota bacterium]HPN63573.1 twin-arginine translocase subunit TatC [Candidatus Goldiibacteriota bacterium]HRQ42720.1 twin-arginine translocase subunit TatC [Candidatus Goldiibacteriota bacterium]
MKKAAKKKTNKKTAPEHLPDFVLHLEELRFRIIAVIIFFMAAFFVSFAFCGNIMQFLQQPVAGAADKLYYFRPYEKFTVYLKVSAVSALFFSVPFLLAQLWGFVKPALNAGEKVFFAGGLLAAPAVFYGGAFFAYKIMLPAAFSFFTGFAGQDNILPVWGVSEYFGFISSVIVVTGAVFLLPLVMLLLMKAGIIKHETVSKARPYIIIAIFIIAAVFSPPDVISQMLVAVPLYLLFEISLLAGRVLKK